MIALDHSLRAARSTDAGRVGAILSAFIDDTPWMPRVHTRAEDLGFAGMMIDRGWVSVAEQNAQVVGFLARDADVVQALYVDDAARGQGVGGALLMQAQSQTQRLTLWTFQPNSRAQSFYLSKGFREIQRTDGTGNDEGVPDIQYLWERG